MMRTTACQLVERPSTPGGRNPAGGSDGVILEPLRVGALQHVDHEAFGFLGFDLRRVHKRTKDGYTIQMTPKKNGPKGHESRDTGHHPERGRHPRDVIVDRVKAAVAGWVNYFRVGNSSRAFSEVRDHLEMKIRTLLTRRKRRRKTGIGWRRWSNAYVYGVLGLYWDWKIHPLPGATTYA
jgi:RNA-directed DNA polymerase